MKKEAKPEQRLKEECSELIQSVKHWKDINENGCSDPFWSDGDNMNLVRNYILFHKKNISDICSENGFSFPEEYYIPIPPEVPRGYMANLKQQRRVERLRQMGNRLTTKKTHYDDLQMSFV